METFFGCALRCVALRCVRMEAGEVIYEKVFASPRPLAKISFDDNWTKEMGSEVAQRPEGQVGQQFHKFPIEPTNSKPRS